MAAEAATHKNVAGGSATAAAAAVIELGVPDANDNVDDDDEDSGNDGGSGGESGSPHNDSIIDQLLPDPVRVL